MNDHETNSTRPSPVRTWPWALGLVSLLLHAVSILMLTPFDGRPRLGKPAGASPSVRIKLVEAAPRPLAVKSPTRPQTAGRRPRRPAAESPASASAPSTAGKSYEDLLPSGSWKGGDLPGDVMVPQGTNVGISPPTRAAIDEFSSRLDIPIFARTKGGPARAVAKVRRLPDGRFMLDYLDGDPLMRACLYVALIQRDNLEILARIMRAEERDEFLLTFAHSESLSVNLSRYVDDFLLADGRLTIARTTFQPVPHPGMALPDEHAKRAARRDRSQLDRLQDTPAFHAPLRRRLLP